ncbi:MAG: U32 family peptidase [Prevotellaceae bacterium]|nr:U32 family peptidase [Prevotellaceae bacterium]
MTRNDIEIMAPAGSYESLMAAIQGGADSVYFGVERLNMRSKSANNFQLDKLGEIAALCNELGIKSYLTLNTIMYDSDLPVMRRIIDMAKEAGVSAVIASDQSAILYAAEKGVEVHISTQLNISNIETLRFYAKFAEVVVLARELTLEQVAEISHQIHAQDVRGPRGELIKIEMFAHGALCMSISGKCYLSLHEYDRSANRGGCLQTCRRAYVVTDKETGSQLEIDNEYIMSPKDLCTISFMDKMIKAGVTVFKIEGRARSGEYVETVSRCYSEAAQAVADGTYSKEKIDEWTKRLEGVFNRGFWGGYYLGKKLGEWSEVYGNRSLRRKEYVAKCTNYFSNIGVAEFLIESGELKVSDSILVLGPTTGVVEQTVKEIRVDLKPVDVAKKGERCSILIEKIRRSDRLYKWVENKWLETHR